MDTKFKGVDTSKMSWSESGHPAKRDIIKTKVNQPGSMGYESWENQRPGKVAIKGGQK